MRLRSFLEDQEPLTGLFEGCDDIDAGGNQLTVLGQTVLVTPETHVSLGGRTLNKLRPGQGVEVSGFTDASGRIVASYLGASNATSAADLTGTVTGSDPAAMTLSINGIEVDYSSAGQFELASGTPRIGERVAISGRRDARTGQIIADSVNPTLDGIDAGGGKGSKGGSEGGQSAHIEGYVAELAGKSALTIDGVDVRVDKRTQFVNGSRSRLAQNARIDVRGQVTQGGVLLAESIEFEPQANLRRVGRVDAVRGNRIVVNGSTIRVNAETSYTDHSGLALRRFTSANLYVGDTIEVIGYRAAGQGFVATRLERMDGSSQNGNGRRIDRNGIDVHVYDD